MAGLTFIVDPLDNPIVVFGVDGDGTSDGVVLDGANDTSPALQQ
ncbi:630_t:CDS:2 [Ambispora leptoticha]|uniref:630_t:CDS:1 n=1 Tax=Ambispora leptoticha TaxID=144679 RepID=A0A9N8WD07_9GLOM|nr:630_t:CDS:2 [Ambispora leptoticha]